MSTTVPDGVEVQMVNELPAVDGGWRLPDLAWGAEAWAVLRLKLRGGALRALGQLLSVLRVSVSGRSLEGEPVALERAGLALAVMSAANFEELTNDELVARRLVELATADALLRMRAAADQADWVTVDRLLEEASRQFAGNEWVAAVLAAMKDIAESRSRERMMKESMYSSAKLRSRLSARNESVSFDAAEESIDVPAYLRRKRAQGKGDALRPRVERAPSPIVTNRSRRRSATVAEPRRSECRPLRRPNGSMTFSWMHPCSAGAGPSARPTQC